MDNLNLDQDRSLKSLSGIPQQPTASQPTASQPTASQPTASQPPASQPAGISPAQFIATENLRFDDPERSLAVGDRVPIVVLHPNGIFRLGIHHAWSTSTFVHVVAVAATWDQLGLGSHAVAIRVGIMGLPNPLDGPDQPGIDQQLAELARVARDNPQVRWIVLANSLPNGYREVIADMGVAGLVVGEFTPERLESVVMWVKMGRSIGLDEPTNSLASTFSTVLQDTATVPNDRLLTRVAKRSIGSPKAAIASRYDSGRCGSVSLSELSEREQQVLDGLAEGKTNQQIADGLFLSVKTIETYRSRLKQKLGVTDRASMVAILNRHLASLDSTPAGT